MYKICQEEVNKMKKVFATIILLFLIFFAASCGSASCSISNCQKEIYADGLCYEHYMMATDDTDADSQEDGDEGNEVHGTSPQNEEELTSTTPDRVEGANYIGDTVSMSISSPSSKEVGHCDITMTDWGTYENPFSKTPGVYLTFEVINTGAADISINSYDFKAYVNNYSVDIDLEVEDPLSATLSSGRQTSGNVYILTDPDDVNSLELELGDAIFRIQENNFLDGSETEETILSDFSYDNLQLYGGSYDGNNDTSIFVSVYSSFDEGNILGSVALYDSLGHEAFADIRDDREGDGIYTLCYDNSIIMHIRFYQDPGGGYCADIQGLDEIYINGSQIETYIMTEQYIP